MHAAGKFVFILHSHIPYVMNHGAWPHGEHWLYEAAAETYIPLLKMLERSVADGRTPGITIGLTPVLVEQLKSDGFRSGFSRFLEYKIRLASNDLRLFNRDNDERMATLARMWLSFYQDAYERFADTYNEDIVDRFRQLQDAGAIDILTCAATHGYLPLLSDDACVRAQVKAGVHVYRKHFGRDPEGIWMPECAYRPAGYWTNPIFPEQSHVRAGVDEILVEEGLSQTVVDSPLLGNANLLGVYSDKPVNLAEVEFTRTPYAPYRLTTGLQLFVRDHVTGYQVWSRQQGYPGDPGYLEFHKMKDTSGIKYWRITGSDADLGDKEPYDPVNAGYRVRQNAGHFVQLIRKVLTDYQSEHDREGMLVAPFDAELFGHWWFEGPDWLDQVLTLLEQENGITAARCSEMKEAGELAEVVQLPEGSWGENADHSVWLNEATMWTFRILYPLEQRFLGTVNRAQGRLNDTQDLSDVMREAGKSLLILQASDWQFLIHTGTAVDYASERFRRHADEVRQLLELADRLLEGGRLLDAHRVFIRELNRKNDCFQDLSINWWSHV